MHPRTYGPYTLLSVLGGSGFGRVHVGRTDKGARVALRVIRPEFAADPRFRACLRDEVEVASRVRSPRVAALLDADVEADVPWLAAEYVPAPSLAAMLERCGPLSVDGVRRLGVELAEALEAIHHAGAVHRNLTPRNVLVTADGPRVVDVGISRAAAASPLTRGGGLVGTPGYLAPEQLLNGPGEPASDVFALASVLLNVATWREPFGTGEITTVLHRVLRVGPDLRGLDPGLVPLIAACLHPDPTRRPTARELRDALAGSGPTPPAVNPGDDAVAPTYPPTPDDGSAVALTGSSHSEPADAVPTPRTPADDGDGPSAEVPAQEVPVHEVSAHEVPVHEDPAQEVPAHEDPAQEIPVHEDPAQEIPVHEDPAQEDPAHEDPVQEARVQDVPPQDIPMQDIPTHAAPQDTPARSVPAQEVPAPS